MQQNQIWLFPLNFQINGINVTQIYFYTRDDFASSPSILWISSTSMAEMTFHWVSANTNFISLKNNSKCRYRLWYQHTSCWELETGKMTYFGRQHALLFILFWDQPGNVSLGKSSYIWTGTVKHNIHTSGTPKR